MSNLKNKNSNPHTDRQGDEKSQSAFKSIDQNNTITKKT